MNDDDHAIVIGISRYADADDESRWITNLRGPDNDAKAVAEWLRRPDGGGLPHDNVRVIRSADESDPGQPQQAKVATALDEISDLPRTTADGYSGRRLYVYASGHGMSRTRGEAALVTADARANDALNVLLTSWTQWSREAGRFHEFVLWFDGCATRLPLLIFRACAKEPKQHPDRDLVRVFEAFAAGGGKDAVEAEVVPGIWHGVFTYALLQALDGAAGAVVETVSLKRYLQNTMAQYMRKDQRIAPVASEPTFGLTDDLEFATYPEARRYPVTLVFPEACAGRSASVGDAVQVLPASGEWQLELAAGMYAAQVPELGLSLPFQVIGRSVDARIALQ